MLIGAYIGAVLALSLACFLILQEIDDNNYDVDWFKLIAIELHVVLVCAIVGQAVEWIVAALA